MKTVILAGGFGSRISEETKYKPKPLIEIGGKPILWHIMKGYSYYGFNEFIICAGYKQHLIKSWFADYYLRNCDITFDFTNGREDTIIHDQHCEPWKVTVVDTGLNTMTGGRIKRIQKYIGDEPFMNKIATLTATMLEPSKGILDIGGDNAVKNFREKNFADSAPINAGYMVLNPEVFDYIDGDDTIFENDSLTRLANDNQLMSFVFKGFWQCMDTYREKDILEKLWENNQAPWKVWDK